MSKGQSIGLKAEIQIASSEKTLPTETEIQHWLNTAFPNLKDKTVLIRFVDETESAELNHSYRNKTGATNILSFPLELPEHIPNNQLGDLVICAPLTLKEATEQNKPANNHYCHLLIHGVLHLQGYDHIAKKDAKAMETLETELLEKLKIPNPYQ